MGIAVEFGDGVVGRAHHRLSGPDHLPRQIGADVVEVVVRNEHHVENFHQFRELVRREAARDRVAGTHVVTPCVVRGFHDEAHIVHLPDPGAGLHSGGEDFVEHRVADGLVDRIDRFAPGFAETGGSRRIGILDPQRIIEDQLGRPARLVISGLRRIFPECGPGETDGFADPAVRIGGFLLLFQDGPGGPGGIALRPFRGEGAQFREGVLPQHFDRFGLSGGGEQRGAEQQQEREDSDDFHCRKLHDRMTDFSRNFLRFRCYGR